MQTFKLIIAIIGIVTAIYLLIKKKDTRTVLIGVGLILCLVSLNPMEALTSFAKRMTSGSLIMAICASMGFAYVMKYTKCDQHLVKILTKPLRGLGFLLIPLTTILTFFINIAIPSAAGCSAAVGGTLIPVLMASGIRPAMAAATVFCGTFGSMLSPGSSHNVFVAEIVTKSTGINTTVADMIKAQLPYTVGALVPAVVFLCLMALIFKDYVKGENFSLNLNKNQNESIQKANIIYALMPLIPLIILIVGGTELSQNEWLKWTKMGVAEAMLLGAIITIIATLTNPEKITKEFFTGMGLAYADVMGIIIAATVFVSGLSETGVVQVAIEWLKGSSDFVRWGGTFGPFFMGLLTGSGDAAAMAFNEAVTPHAISLGYKIQDMGLAAATAGALGRTASPLAGAAIVCAGLAMISPVEVAKRTALGMVAATIFLALFQL